MNCTKICYSEGLVPSWKCVLWTSSIFWITRYTHPYCILGKDPNSTMDRHLPQMQTILKIISHINSQLSIAGTQEGKWSTSKIMSISIQPTNWLYFCLWIQKQMPVLWGLS